LLPIGLSFPYEVLFLLSLPTINYGPYFLRIASSCIISKDSVASYPAKAKMESAPPGCSAKNLETS